MSGEFEKSVQHGISATRWLLAPMYLGLGLMLVILLIQFVRDFLRGLPGWFQMTAPELIPAILGLAIVLLAAHGVLMILHTGYQVFIPGLRPETEPAEGQGSPDFTTLRNRLLALAISLSLLMLLRDMLSGNAHGSAGSRVVIESFLEGEEASFIVVAQGRRYVTLATSQDHKRIFDGDQGPNTGGMGAYSPAAVVTPEIHARICTQVIEPTLAGMEAEGNAFGGFLYAGLMIDARGDFKVLEFNTRLGDPETQPIVFRLESDLFDLLEAALDDRLGRVDVRWTSQPALGVVMAAHGYPGTVRKGDPISGLDADLGSAKAFHAGTTLHKGQPVTAGGRVLCVVARGADVRRAQQGAYAAVHRITWDGVQFRGDIGHRAIARSG